MNLQKKMTLNALGLIETYPYIAKSILRDLIKIQDKIILKERIIWFFIGIFYGVVLCLLFFPIFHL